MLRSVARLVAGVVGLVLWGTVALAGLSGLTYYKPASAAVAIGDRGTARVADCVRSGPVSFNGLGYWWECEADVVWDGGGAERVRVDVGQFTPDDRGRDIRVLQRLEHSTKAGKVAHVYREDFEPSVLLGLGSVLGGLGIGFLLFVVVFGSTLSATERKIDTRGKA